MSDVLKPMLARRVVVERDGQVVARGVLGFDGDTYFVRTHERFHGDRADLPASLHAYVRLDARSRS